MTKRQLVAVLACRNGGSRLYGKPLQRLHIETGWTILDQIVANLRQVGIINKIVLAISTGADNGIYIDYAINNGLSFVVGDEIDVLSRLLLGLKESGGTDLFRVSTESPFLYSDAIDSAWKSHVINNADATFLDDIIDGCGFEIITRDALNASWSRGDQTHRSELCSLFIRQNTSEFNVNRIPCPQLLRRLDLRLTVDYPEDLIVVRAIYKDLLEPCPHSRYDLFRIVKYLDSRPELISLIIPFTEVGYSSMYL